MLFRSGGKASGVPVGGINLVLMLLTAVTVSVASRIVGALMISSLLVIPVAAAMMIAKSYKQTIWWSIAFAEFFTVAGLFISYYLDLRPGGTIVLTNYTLFTQLFRNSVNGRKRHSVNLVIYIFNRKRCVCVLQYLHNAYTLFCTFQTTFYSKVQLSLSRSSHHQTYSYHYTWKKCLSLWRKLKIDKHEKDY